MATNEVGTAYVVIRAITDKAKDDIKKAFSDGFKNTDTESATHGRRSGKIFGEAFKAGLAEARIGSALDSTFHMAEASAATAGDRAGAAYARAYRSRVESETRNVGQPTLNNPNDNTSSNSEEVAAEERARRAASAQADAEARRVRRDADAADREAEREADRERSRSRIAPVVTPTLPRPVIPAVVRTPAATSGASGGDNSNEMNRSTNAVRQNMAAMRDLKRTINQLGDIAPVRMLTSALGSIRTMLIGIIPLALAATAALALQGAIGAIGGVLGALTQMMAVLIMVPALAVAAAAGIGALVLGLSGISKAYSALAASEKKSGEEGRDWADAHRKALQSVDNAMNGVVVAQHSAATAQQSLTSAAESATDSQKDLNQAYQDSTRDLRDMNMQLEGSKLSVEGASYAVQNAALALYKANSTPGTTQLQRNEANLAYKEAVLRLKEQKTRTADLAQDTAKANSEGIDGSKRVTDAKRAERDATQNLANSQFAMTQAVRNVSQAQIALADAQRELNKQTNEASASQKALNEAMANLSPIGRDFVYTLRELAPAWKEMKFDVQDALLRGLGDTIVNFSNAQLPTLKTGLTGTAEQLGFFAKDMLAAFSTPEAVEEFKVVFSNINEMFKNMRPGMVFIAEGFMNMVNVGSTLLPRFGGWISEISLSFRNWSGDTEYLTTRMNNAVAVLGGMGEILGGLAGTWGAIFNTGAVIPMIDALGALSRQMEGYFQSVEGQVGVFDFFTNATAALSTLGPILSGLLEGISEIGSGLLEFEIAGAEGITNFINGIVGGLEEIRPVMSKIGAAAGELGTMFGPLVTLLGEKLADAAVKVLPMLVSAGEYLRDIGVAMAPLISIFATFITAAWAPLSAILAVVVPLFKGFIEVIDALSPFLAPLAVLIGAAVIALMGFLKAQAGVLAMTTMLQKLAGTATVATGSLVALSAAAGAAHGRLGGAATNARNFGSNMSGAFRDSMRWMQQANPHMSTAGAAMRIMGTNAAGAFSAVRAGAGSALAALGGPWVIAITAAVMLFAGFNASAKEGKRLAAEYEESIQKLATSQRETMSLLLESKGATNSQVLSSLTEQVNAVTSSFKTAGENEATFTNMLSDMVGDLVKPWKSASDDISFEKDRIAFAAQAASQALKDMKLSDEELAAKLASGNVEWDIFKRQLIDTGEGGRMAADKMQELRDQLKSQQDVVKSTTPGMVELQDAMAVLADKTASAEDKASALRSALESLGIIQVDAATVAKNYGEAVRTIADGSVIATGGIDTLGRNLFDAGNKLDTFGNVNAAGLHDKLLDLGEKFTDQALATGNANEAYAQAAPAIEKLREQYQLEGADLERLLALYGLKPELVQTLIKLDGTDTVETQLSAVSLKLASLDPDQPKKLTMVGLTEDAEAKLKGLDFTVTSVVQNGTRVFTVEAKTDLATQAVTKIMGELANFGRTIATANVDADNTGFMIKTDAVRNALGNIDTSTASPQIKAVIDDFVNGRNVTLGALQGLDLASASPEIRLGIQNALNDANVITTALSDMEKREYVIKVHAQMEAKGQDQIMKDIASAVEIYGKWSPEALAAARGEGVAQKADGGAVIGPGTGTSDDIPARLSNGEHVFTASDVAKAGGQGAMYRMRESIQAGTMPRFAKGGAVLRFAGGGAVAGGGGGASDGIDWNSMVSGASASLRSVGTMFQGTWKQQILPEWNQLSLGLSTTAETVIDPMFEGVGKNLSGMGNMFQSQATGVIAPSWLNMASNLSDVQGKILSPAVAQIGNDITDFATQVSKSANTVITPTWNQMASNLNGAKVAVIDPALRGIQGGMQTTVDSFAVGANAMGIHFDTIRAKTHDPVKWTIDNVINGGIVGAWNAVASTIGTTPLVPFTYMAEGGLVTGGEENKDSVPTMLMPGEVVLNKNAVQAAGRDALISFNAANRSGISTPNRNGVPGPDFKGGHAQPLLPGLAGGGTPEEARKSLPPTGGTVQAGAEITTALQQSMWDAVRTAFPNVTLNSGTRYADVGSGFDNHMGQRALDLGGPMPEIARWIYQMNNTQPVEELIHAPLDGWQNLKGGAPLDFGAGTDAQHYDHVHWAMANMVNNEGKLVSMGGSSGPGGRPNVQAMAQKMVQPILDNMHAAVNGLSIPGNIGALPAAMMGTTETAMNAKIAELASKVSASVGGGLVTAKGSGPVVEQVKRAMAPYGWDKGPQWEALDQLIAHESSWNPDIGYSGPVNSDAYGLFQFLGTTWDDVGGEKTSDPYQQAVYGARYIQQRYGDPIGAWAHWQNPPDGNGNWYDNGGVIPPGVTKVVNETGQPEALLNPSQWSSVQDAIGVATQVADGNGVAPADGAVQAVVEVATLIVNAANVTINGAVQGAQAAVSQAMAAPMSAALPDTNYSATVNDAVSTATVDATSAATTALSASVYQDRINEITARLDDTNRRMNETVDDAENARLREEVAKVEAELAAAYAEQAAGEEAAPADASTDPATLSANAIADANLSDADLGVKSYSSSWLNNTPIGYAYNEAFSRNQALEAKNGPDLGTNWRDPNQIVANAFLAAQDLFGPRPAAPADPAAAGAAAPAPMSPEAQAWMDRLSPEARAAVENTYGAAPIDNANFTNIGTDPNDPRLDNPNTDPAMYGAGAAGGPTPFDGYLATQQEAATKWGEDAFKEITGQFLDPLGLSAPVNRAVDEFGPVLRKAVTQGVTDALIARDNAELGMTGQVPTAPQQQNITFNGMDPQKAMDELGRLFNQGMASVSRYRA